jgi:hypothetical protein
MKMNRREALTIIGEGAVFLVTPKSLPMFSLSESSVLDLRDAYEVSGPMEDFMQPGFEAPTYGEDGKISGTVRISHIDRAINTIWLESC